MSKKSNEKKFLEIPAISIQNGSIMIAQKDRYEILTIDDKVPDTLDLIELITETYETIYLIDLNGLLEGKPQLKLIKELSDFCELWLDAGVVEAESIYDLFIGGAHEVVLSSKTLDGIMELASAYELSENLIFELDYSEGVLSPSLQIQDMSPQKIGQELVDIGIQKIIFADLGRINTNQSIKNDVIVSLVAQDLQVFVGGGIRLRDVPTLKKLGTSGAIIELTDILQHGTVNL